MPGNGETVRMAKRIRTTNLEWSVGAAGPLLRLAADHDDTHWRDFARCQESDPDLFFPEIGDKAREAVAICAGCPVRNQCLNYAITHNERFGIWGGLSRHERQRWKRRAA